MSRKNVNAFILTMAVAFPALAFDAGSLKRADDRAANWLIEKYDFKTNMLKGEPQDLMKYAIIVTSFCRHPHDYKEAAGPWVTGPVKYILSQVKEDGSLATPGTDE